LWQTISPSFGAPTITCHRESGRLEGAADVVLTADEMGRRNERPFRPNPLRVTRGVGDSVEMRQHLAPRHVETEHTRSAVEAVLLEMLQELMNRGCPGSGSPSHRGPYSNDRTEIAAGEDFFANALDATASTEGRCK
jgi:hypothetical protein